MLGVGSDAFLSRQYHALSTVAASSSWGLLSIFFFIVTAFSGTEKHQVSAEPDLWPAVTSMEPRPASWQENTPLSNWTGVSDAPVVDDDPHAGIHNVRFGPRTLSADVLDGHGAFCLSKVEVDYYSLSQLRDIETNQLRVAGNVGHILEMVGLRSLSIHSSRVEWHRDSALLADCTRYRYPPVNHPPGPDEPFPDTCGLVSSDFLDPRFVEPPRCGENCSADVAPFRIAVVNASLCGLVDWFPRSFTDAYETWNASLDLHGNTNLGAAATEALFRGDFEWRDYRGTSIRRVIVPPRGSAHVVRTPSANTTVPPEAERWGNVYVDEGTEVVEVGHQYNQPFGFPEEEVTVFCRPVPDSAIPRVDVIEIIEQEKTSYTEAYLKATFVVGGTTQCTAKITSVPWLLYDLGRTGYVRGSTMWGTVAPCLHDVADKWRIAYAVFDIAEPDNELTVVLVGEDTHTGCIGCRNRSFRASDCDRVRFPATEDGMFAAFAPPSPPSWVDAQQADVVPVVGMKLSRRSVGWYLTEWTRAGVDGFEFAVQPSFTDLFHVRPSACVNNTGTLLIANLPLLMGGASDMLAAILNGTHYRTWASLAYVDGNVSLSTLACGPAAHPVNEEYDRGARSISNMGRLSTFGRGHSDGDVGGVEPLHGAFGDGEPCALNGSFVSNTNGTVLTFSRVVQPMAPGFYLGYDEHMIPFRMSMTRAGNLCMEGGAGRCIPGFVQRPLGHVHTSTPVCQGRAFFRMNSGYFPEMALGGLPVQTGNLSSIVYTPVGPSADEGAVAFSFADGALLNFSTIFIGLKIVKAGSFGVRADVNEHLVLEVGQNWTALRRFVAFTLFSRDFAPSTVWRGDICNATEYPLIMDNLNGGHIGGSFVVDEQAIFSAFQSCGVQIASGSVQGRTVSDIVLQQRTYTAAKTIVLIRNANIMETCSCSERQTELLADQLANVSVVRRVDALLDRHAFATGAVVARSVVWAKDASHDAFVTAWINGFAEVGTFVEFDAVARMGEESRAIPERCLPDCGLIDDAQIEACWSLNVTACTLSAGKSVQFALEAADVYVGVRPLLEGDLGLSLSCALDESRGPPSLSSMLRGSQIPWRPIVYLSNLSHRLPLPEAVADYGLIARCSVCVDLLVQGTAPMPLLFIVVGAFVNVLLTVIAAAASPWLDPLLRRAKKRAALAVLDPEDRVLVAATLSEAAEPQEAGEETDDDHGAHDSEPRKSHHSEPQGLRIEAESSGKEDVRDDDDDDASPEYDVREPDGETVQLLHTDEGNVKDYGSAHSDRAVDPGVRARDARTRRYLVPAVWLIAAQLLATIVLAVVSIAHAAVSNGCGSAAGGVNQCRHGAWRKYQAAAFGVVNSSTPGALLTNALLLAWARRPTTSPGADAEEGGCIAAVRRAARTALNVVRGHWSVGWSLAFVMPAFLTHSLPMLVLFAPVFIAGSVALPVVLALVTQALHALGKKKRRLEEVRDAEEDRVTALDVASIVCNVLLRAALAGAVVFALQFSFVLGVMVYDEGLGWVDSLRAAYAMQSIACGFEGLSTSGVDFYKHLLMIAS